MQLFNREEYSEQAESNRTRTITTAAPRGRILDRDGNELVTNRPSLTVLADPEVVDNEVEMRLLANLIGMPYLAVRRKIQSQLEGAQSNRTVAVDVSRRVVAFIAEHPYLFDNIYTEERPQRHYPNGSLAAHVLGYTGSITSDQLEWSWNHEGEGNIAYESSDTVGQAGVEYQYESVLQGIRGEQVVYVDAYGTVLDYSTSIAAQSGSDVVLTINAKVQKAAEESLAKRIKLISESTCEECDAGAAEDLEDLNAELEDALLLISELDPRDGDEREELAGALEDLRALAGDYRSLAKAVPGVAEQARRLDMAAGLALSALDE